MRSKCIKYTSWGTKLKKTSNKGVKMAVTILECLQNANHNLGNLPKIGMGLLPLVKEQLNNAITLLEKGYDLDELVEPLLEKYSNIEDVPIA